MARPLLSNLASPRALGWEGSIVWLYEPDQFNYVRECLMQTHYRGRQPRADGFPGLLVAYTVLRADTPSVGYWYGFWRRAWWIARWDPYPKGYGFPVEAVDPESIRVGEPSRLRYVARNRRWAS